MTEDLTVAPGKVLPRSALQIKTARASGPGGQHVNKTETKVQIAFDPRAVPWIDEGTRLRVIALAGRNVDSEGRVHVSSQEYRDKERNMSDACEKLVQLLQKALVRPKRRLATKPTKASKRRRLDDKKRQSIKKEGRTRGAAD